MEKRYAIELISDLTWNLYRVWGTVVKYIVWITKVSRTERLKLAVRSFLTFPFSPPTYQIERLPTSEGIDLNVTRCPVAEYFRTESATDLCTESWCNLDFALAEMWDGHLERTKTLALGNNHCNFKFTAK
ncbi:MAG: hypothetical protein HKN33_07580 [Pyrinomonadaceae bacterium]|nr:hypothetical protein [Pyrinomonadaceae bacterium]